MQIYKALALQTDCHAVNRCTDHAEALEIMKSSIARMRGQILSGKAFHGPDMKLVCLPEYALTGFPMGETAAVWREKAAVEMNGEIYDLIGEMAEASACYIGINLYERDPHFPALYFQASTLFAPNGDCVLRYRRLISMYAPSPYDVLETYLEHYTLEDLFPVADTPLGRLAALASEEIRYPEISRILAARGAEVILHPTSEAASTQMTYKNVAKLARAQENQCYIVSANSSAITHTALAAQSTDGRSQIVDDRGIILAEVPGGESISACADVDIAALRYRRARNGMDNMLARQPLELYATLFSQMALHPSGTLGDGSEAPKRDFYKRRQDEVIERLKTLGVI
jgi:predicted amidohydrolase